MSTLVRVVFEYSDGTKKFISEEELDKWQRYNSLVASCAQNHGMNPPWEDIKWRKIGKERSY